MAPPFSPYHLNEQGDLEENDCVDVVPSSPDGTIDIEEPDSSEEDGDRRRPKGPRGPKFLREARTAACEDVRKITVSPSKYFLFKKGVEKKLKLTKRLGSIHI